MKIHKVKEKKMDIHRKKEKEVRDLSRERTSSFKRIRESVRDSGASVDMVRGSLYTMGRRSVRKNMDGGEEISDSLELMGIVSGSTYRTVGGVRKAVGKNTGRSRQKKRYAEYGLGTTRSSDGGILQDDNSLVENLKTDKGKNAASRKNMKGKSKIRYAYKASEERKKSNSSFRKQERSDTIAEEDYSKQKGKEYRKRKNARDRKARDDSGMDGRGSKQGRYSRKSRMIATYIDNLNKEEQQADIVQATKEIVKKEAILVVKRIIATILPAVGGSIALIALVAGIIMLLLAVIYQSPMAIFFPKIDTGYDDIRLVLSSYYMDFNKEVMAIEENGDDLTYQNTKNGTPVSNYRDTLMVYMILYGDGKASYVMDDEGKRNLKKVFDEMNYIDSASSATQMEVGDSLGEVWVTAYCSCSICCGPYANGVTASGKTARAKHTIAVDAYNPIVPMGTKVVIDGTVYTVEDTGDLNHHGNDFDVYFSDHGLATQFGRKHIEAFIAEGNTNTVTVISSGSTVHNLTYKDYINKGTMNEDQKTLLTELMDSELWNQYYGDSIGEEVAQMALSKVGCGYSQDRRYDEGWYDCSSLVYRLYKEVGVDLPLVASTQGEYCFQNAMIINREELRPGDIIFYSTEENGVFRNITHVAIYVGDGMMVHAANSRRGVVLDPLRENNVVFYARPYR